MMLRVYTVSLVRSESNFSAIHWSGMAPCGRVVVGNEEPFEGLHQLGAYLDIGLDTVVRFGLFGGHQRELDIAAVQ